MAELSEVADEGGRSMRLAIEGCGHGTLDAIYASVQKACELKGWDGIDLLIICGDFQAVRDRLDLNVTAMPAKYRQMADFHHYYWGSKVAPFLTIFIGGNHEASNHLFELYYGGWVAQNIYYLGAANVVQVGPLKIAGLSGIWKGYDFRKPHYERLPYNEEDISSIYHVRELDVRKLLAFRSQVDIGLSHDWPQGIEWLGDHARLFRHKGFLEGDAVSGKLGSVAANQVLEHLRPPYWFSAHLHTRYSALKIHDQNSVTATGNTLTSSEKQNQVSAWNKFGNSVQASEAEENKHALQQQNARREEAQRTGIPAAPTYTYAETHKKVKLDDGFVRTLTDITGVERSASEEQEFASIPQLDGCCQSMPAKRRRESGESHDLPVGSVVSAQYPPVHGLPNMGGVNASAPSTAVAANPDAIDIEMSDDEFDSGSDTNLKSQAKDESLPLLKKKDSYEDSVLNGNDGEKALLRPGNGRPDANISLSTYDNKSIHSVYPLIAHSNEEDSVPPRMPTIAMPDLSHAPQMPANQIQEISASITNGVEKQAQPVLSTGEKEGMESNDVSDDVRAQLAALSSKFADKPKASAPLPHPEDITNKKTEFLALSKCESGQHFLQLMEINPTTKPKQEVLQPPFKIQYVPEWLAILRVFAPELHLGPDAKRKPVPPHKGDAYYHEQILQEENWIHENVVEMDLLTVPENFTLTKTPLNDDIETEGKMPSEVTNPQTVTFCNLIGIENPFHEEDNVRKAREMQGPPALSEGFGQFNGGRGGRGQRGRGRGGGGRGGGGRGRGGRNRGRGGRGY